eukprot:snap_masked-scaffold1054_size66621-processed-gene-0.3 protein:Tk00475 transcript:snap_masked-scaffold1054_size66621-processed-gene-0.3-mRNA-1 annotation:"nf-kappa-b inhibitor epsilon-like"
MLRSIVFFLCVLHLTSCLHLRNKFGLSPIRAALTRTQEEQETVNRVKRNIKIEGESLEGEMAREAVIKVVEWFGVLLAQ